MDSALAFLAHYIQDVWPILQSSLRYVTDPKYFHQTPWNGITSLPISILCIFLRKLKITACEHWSFDCSISKLNSLKHNNNKGAEDSAWSLWDKIVFFKKHYLISSSGVKSGKIGALKTLMNYRSTIMLQLLQQSYCIIRLIFPWTCPGLRSKRAIFSIFTLCNFQFSQFSELQVSTFFEKHVSQKKILDRGLIFWFTWTLQQDFKCCWKCQRRKMCVIVLQMIT